MEPLEIIRLIAPEYNSVNDDTIGGWIALTRPLVSARKFGELYAQAVALLTLHRMKLSGAFEAESGGGSGVGDTLP